MRLAEVQNFAEFFVERDVDFENLGFLGQRFERLLMFIEDARFLAALRARTGVSAVLTTPKLAAQIPPEIGLGVCDQPRVAFAKIHNELARRDFYWEAIPNVIDADAAIHRTASIADRSVRICAGSTIGPHAVVSERCFIGQYVVVGAGTVLGGVGFQTIKCAAPMIEMEHAGGLLIGNGARILPGAVIATGVFREPTRIGEQCRIGSNAFVSHGVQLGKRVFIGHGAVINGNVVVGDDVWIGPGAVISQNLEIGERAFVSLGSVVIRDIEPKGRVSGNFAVKHRRLLRMLSTLDRDPA